MRNRLDELAGDAGAVSHGKLLAPEPDCRAPGPKLQARAQRLHG